MRVYSNHCHQSNDIGHWLIMLTVCDRVVVVSLQAKCTQVRNPIIDAILLITDVGDLSLSDVFWSFLQLPNSILLQELWAKQSIVFVYHSVIYIHYCWSALVRDVTWTNCNPRRCVLDVNLTRVWLETDHMNNADVDEWHPVYIVQTYLQYNFIINDDWIMSRMCSCRVCCIRMMIVNIIVVGEI